jgi:2-polyprenyl-6-methoxyphenol hydroxylase-like FAD-dependent oxidoreductase
MIPNKTEVLIIGGGPAGSLLGCLLARRGIDVLVVEKQADVERSFRGETLVSASNTALRALGFGPALEAHGYLETHGMKMSLEGRHVMDLEYRRTRAEAPHIDMPQPSLLKIINASASEEPSYHYAAGTAMTDLVEDPSGVVTGAVLRLPDGSRSTVHARLVVGADGRFSKVRKASRLEAKVTPMDRDVLWFKVPRPEGWSLYTEFFVDGDRHVMALPTYPNDLRCAANLPKRGFSQVRAEGLDAFKQSVAQLDPRLGPLMDKHLKSWDDTSFLEIFTAHVTNWARDGLLLIGDASHTCTPILGQGVNLSIQDCVRVTPIIAAALRDERDAKPLPGGIFTEFIEERRKHKNRVTRFQTVQENSLAVNSARGIFLRRMRFRTLNRIPGAKHMILSGVLGTVPIHREDMRDHSASVTVVNS